MEVFHTGGGFYMYSIAYQHMFLFMTQGSVMPELVLGSNTVALQLRYSFEKQL